MLTQIVKSFMFFCLYKSKIKIKPKAKTPTAATKLVLAHKKIKTA